MGSAGRIAVLKALTGSPKASFEVRGERWSVASVGLASAWNAVQEVIAIFRVSQKRDRSGTVVSIDGQLSGEYVQVAETCCTLALSSGTPVSLFLRDVFAIDEAGRDLLRRLAQQGVRLLASGIYTSHLVKSLQHAETTQQPAGSGGAGRRHP
jgi:hypothetical protein